MTVRVEATTDGPYEARPVEVVERKGLGHPDTICDALAEEVSRALCRAYLERFGQVLHHNVDKALLLGGSAAPRFGGGEVLAPIEIDLAGRVTTSFRGVDIPVEEHALQACREWLRAHLHALDPDRHVRLRCRFRPGSAALVEVFARGKAARTALANDTSLGVGFAPLSQLERAVLEIEGRLNAPETKSAAPEIGEDVKVMAVRADGTARITVACALVSRHVTSAADYLEKKGRVGALARKTAQAVLGDDVEVAVNAADDPSADSFFLTITGTSAESGDDGEVGRGNRASGLITPGRPMTLEATAGKNPISHVGKLYNVLAMLIAEDIVASAPDVSTAECYLTSRIGAPVDEPQLASVRLATRDGRPASEVAPAVQEIVHAWLRRIPSVSEDIIAGRARLY